MAGANKSMSRAYTLDPLNFKIALDLSQIHMLLGSRNEKQDDLVLAKKWAGRAVKLNPWDPEVRFLKAKTHLLLSEVDEAIREIEEARELSPLSQRYYDALSEIYLLAGKYYASIGEKEKAKTALKATTEVLQRVNVQNSKIPPISINLAPQLVNSTVMQNNTKQALDMLKQL